MQPPFNKCPHFMILYIVSVAVTSTIQLKLNIQQPQPLLPSTISNNYDVLSMHAYLQSHPLIYTGVVLVMVSQCFYFSYSQCLDSGNNFGLAILSLFSQWIYSQFAYSHSVYWIFCTISSTPIWSTVTVNHHHLVSIP